MRQTWLLAMAAAAVLSCGDDTMRVATQPDLSMTSSGGDMALASGDMARAAGDMAMASGGDMAKPSGDMATTSAGSVPDPGSVMAGSQLFFDNPGNANANDTPATATPMGIGMGGDLTMWVTQNMMTAANQADYFVFKSGASAGNFVLGFGGVCSSPANVLAKIDLWTVSGGMQQTPPIKEWQPNSSCTTGSTPIAANTVYLLGFIGNGVVGSYSA